MRFHERMTDLNALFKFTYGLYVVGVKDGEKFGGCVVDAVMQTTVEPPTLVLCCGKTTRTRELLLENKAFSLSVLPDDVDTEIIKTFGFQSARTADKWAAVKHRLRNGLPVLDDAAAWVVCDITDWRELSTHTLFFATIVDAENGAKKPLSYTDYRERKTKGGKTMKYQWVCKVCGYVYDGDTPFEELPDDYVCPVCGVSKADFEKVEVKEK